MLRLALLTSLVTASGCFFWDERGSGPGPFAAPDAGPIDPNRCPLHTGTIFEPADGATVPRTVTFRMRWNEPGIPDRFMSMSDDFGNFFISGGETINGDGSISVTFDLPGNGNFNFEMGWFCDAGNDGPTIVLAKRRIHTAP
jgi:hypothetical protein